MSDTVVPGLPAREAMIDSVVAQTGVTRGTAALIVAAVCAQLPQRRGGRKLGNMRNVRRAYADVFRRLEDGTLKPAHATAMDRTLEGLQKAIEGSEWERRLAALEDASTANGVEVRRAVSP